MSKVNPRRLGDLITLKRGYDLPEKDRTPGPYPVISSAGVSGCHNEYKVEGQGVVTGRYGTLGEMYFVDGKYWPHNTALYVQDFKGNDPKYIYYLLSCLGRIRTSDKSAVPGVNRNELHEMAVPAIEDKNLQIEVRKVLETLDQKIELNNRINAELEAMAKTLYDYWFVQFDFPDDSPQRKGKPYKTSGGKMVHNPTIKREIPKGWEVDTLSSWIKSDKTGDWGKEEQEGNYTIQVDCIRGADINGLNGNGKINAPNRFILRKNDHKLLAPFDFVIEISGGSPTQSTGRMAYITDDVLNRFPHPLICSNFCKAISLHNKDLFYCFAYLWGNLYDNGILFGWEGKTSGIKNLLFDAFVTKYYVAVPPVHLAKQFFDFVAPIEQKKQSLLKESSKLETLRDWLLPMLMNGQVTVK